MIVATNLTENMEERVKELLNRILHPETQHGLVESHKREVEIVNAGQTFESGFQIVVLNNESVCIFKLFEE